jgi:hypothetical protein
MGMWRGWKRDKKYIQNFGEETLGKFPLKTQRRCKDGS